MKKNPMLTLETFGQSFWLDYIRRDLMTSGKLQQLIKNDKLKGMTSNPAIFEKAITGTKDYDEDIRNMAQQNFSVEAIYENLSIADVQKAADEFRVVYDQTNGNDGFVSLEVNPHLANDTKGTIEEARHLWKVVNRPNVMIKVPATIEGVSAFKQLIIEGININVTLLFSLERYRQIAEAYVSAIETRIDQGKSVSNISSVASFFLSRIDTLLDPLLEKMISQGGSKGEIARELLGEVAISSAKEAYQIFKEIFRSARFELLVKKGARVQRLLWASTSTKNPAYSDLKYVEPLIGSDTINTLPMETFEAYRDHGDPKSNTIELDVEKSRNVLRRLRELGINLNDITQQLEEEGVKKFNQPFDKLMASLKKALPVGA